MNERTPMVRTRAGLLVPAALEPVAAALDNGAAPLPGPRRTKVGTVTEAARRNRVAARRDKATAARRARRNGRHR